MMALLTSSTTRRAHRISHPRRTPSTTGGDLEFQAPASASHSATTTSLRPHRRSNNRPPITPDAAPQAESVEGIDASPFANASPMGAELEQPPATSTGAVLDGDSLDDSLAPDASRSGDQPFDFALAEE